MMDPLADVLHSVRLIGGVFLEARFTAPWCVSAQIAVDDLRSVLAAPAQMIAYHVVISGRLLVHVEAEPAIEVQAGEVVLLARNDVHVLASGPGLRPVNASDLIQPAPEGGLARVSHGGGGAETQIVCGFLASDEIYNPLLATLPRVLKLDVRHGLSRHWIEASVRFAAAELAAGRLASSSVMSRLSETLLVEAVRQYSSTLEDRHVGWLRGVQDQHVGRALALMHRDISVTWAAETLAREVALSRSAFMDRFRTLVGMPPIRYLTLLRLSTAKLQLREQGSTVSQLAHAIGYESEEAFSRAFKRAFGVSPARWRDGDRPAHAAREASPTS